ncbi:hypothetical protein, partial [Limosilactobacillus reuteri]
HLKYNASVLAFSIFIRKKRRMAVNYCNSALSSFSSLADTSHSCLNMPPVGNFNVDISMI